MPTLNRRQLRDKYGNDPEFLKKFEDAFTLRLLLAGCIVPDNYTPQSELGDAVALSKRGQELFDELADTSAFASEAETKLAVFLAFYDDELLVDLDNSRTDTIQGFVEREVKAGANIRYPWVFDRELYDRYFELFGEPKNHLSYDETVKLLDGTSPGVFQLGKLVVGPFGLLRSQTRRRLLPTRKVPLWHCSDLSCQALHSAELATGRTSMHDVSSELSKLLSQRATRPSEWFWFYEKNIGDDEWYDDRNAITFPWLLGNAFTELELRSLLASIFDCDGKRIRALLPQTKQHKSLFDGNGETIVGRLSKSQCFHLILLLGDSELVPHIERAVDNGSLFVPHTETRGTVFSRSTRTHLDIVAQCSRYGVRFVSKTFEVGTDRLRALVRHSYKDDLDNLKWRLRHVTGDTVFEKLDRFLHDQTSPIRVLKELVFSDEVKMKAALRFLDCGWIEMPSSQSDEDWLAEKLLWKMGFDVPLYPVYQKSFSDRLTLLLEAARTFTEYNETEEEAIRSAAVNFFVSVEEILDFSLSFSTWTLLCDHVADTAFRFELQDARRFMASKLNGRQIGSLERISFTSNRQNTLFPMIQGFTLLADLCEELLEERQKHLRPASEIPDFASVSRLYTFPFAHTALVLDVRTEDRLRILELLRKTAHTLEAANICDLRNRLEHKRDTFPKQSEIENGCTALSETIRNLEAAGLCPSVYLFARRLSDEFGRGQITFRNFRGTEITVPNPTQFYGCKLPSFSRPQIVVPWIHIGDSFEPIRFSFVERSEYSQRWKDYPRRVKRDASVTESDSEVVEPETSTITTTV